MPVDALEPTRSQESLEQSYALLIEGLRRNLYRFGLRRAQKLLGRAEYEELVHEVADTTFSLALQRWQSYRPEQGPVFYWLFLLGRKEMFLELRRVRREHEVAKAMGVRLEMEELLEAPRRRGMKAFQRVLDGDELERVLRELAPEQMQAMGLFYLLELSLEEVGKVLGKTPAAVSSLLQRGRQSARKLLGRSGETTSRETSMP